MNRTRYALSPAVFNLVPLAHERAVRGAELMLAGGVKRIAGSFYLVRSSDGGAYTVNLAAGSCSCLDGRAPHDGQGRKLCKHVCAALLAETLCID